MEEREKGERERGTDQVRVTPAVRPCATYKADFGSAVIGIVTRARERRKREREPGGCEFGPEHCLR